MPQWKRTDSLGETVRRGRGVVSKVTTKLSRNITSASGEKNNKPPYSEKGVNTFEQIYQKMYESMK